MTRRPAPKWMNHPAVPLQHIAQTARRRYDSFASAYRELDSGSTDAGLRNHYEQLLRTLTTRLTPPLRVLDIGCGTGRYFHCLTGVDRLVGLDVSAQMLAHARRPHRASEITARNVDLICGSVFDQQFPDESFDLIYSVGMLGEYAPITQALCRQIWRWLKPGGALFFTVVDADSKPPQRSLKRMLARCAGPLLPRVYRERLQQERLWRSLYLSAWSLRALLQATPLADATISRHAAAPEDSWQGAHFNCEYKKPSTRRSAPLLGILIVAGLLVGGLLWPTAVSAQVPDLIRYQGQLADAQGVPLDGPYDLTFRLYDAAEGGAALWTEAHADVVMTEGQFSVLLGSLTSLADENWSQPRWLSIQVDTDAEFSPRQQITSVPLAVRAKTAEQLSQAITPSLIAPQGAGSGLDADTVDGKHASDLTARANHTGTQAPSTISPQGSGSGLNSDTLDGQDASAFAVSNHKHSCVNRMGLPAGQSGNGFCASQGEWCVHNLTAGGRDTESCSTVNPGVGDWGAVCCR